MNKTTDVIDTMLDFVHQLKRHTEGRRAMHIKLSVLERPFQEPFYRREVAACLRPLVAHRGAKLFALPNADSVIVTRDASLDDLAPALQDIRKKLKDSAIVGALDPVVGVSDRFVEWFDLEDDYPDFAVYIERLAEGASGKKKMLEIKPVAKPEPAAADQPEAPAVEARPDAVHDVFRDIDDVVIKTILNKLPAMDVSGYLEQEPVMAVVGDREPAPVLMHQFVSVAPLLRELTGAVVTTDNRWLAGYLAERIAVKLLECDPDFSDVDSIGMSVSLTCEAVLSDAFLAFDAKLTGAQRSRIILEFSLIDILANPRRYAAAHQRVDPLGYKVSLMDVEPESLLWLDYEKLQADFIKLHVPQPPLTEWLSPEQETKIATRIGQIGRARVILDGCNRISDIEQGQRLGITLFQGDYFS